MATADPVGQKLQLLLACRQIYNEAVLVPLSANEFGQHSGSFESASELHRDTPFPRNLALDQSIAISILYFRDIADMFGSISMRCRASNDL